MPNSDYNSSDTICAIATAPGGALGVIRISGQKALSIVSNIFSKDIGKAATHTLHHGTIHDTTTGEELDDTVISLFRTPHSYTGDDVVEISCHGSPYILRRIVATIVSQGARLALPGEFTQRAFLAGKMDLTQAEAVADLIASTTQVAHRMAMSQLRGGISNQLATLRSRLLELTALLELELDFSDQDIEFADRTQLSILCNTITQTVAHLVHSFSTGNALKSGVPVAIVGAPNVGKSTLLNTLLGDERAIVSPTEGTTRDTVEDTAVIGGILFRFIDTAGLRHTTDSVERLGIERSRQAAAKARIILMMSEPGVPEPAIETTAEQTVIHIKNKTPEFQAINGTGLPLLLKQLTEAVDIPEEGDTVVTSLRHFEALTLALGDLHRIQTSLTNHTSADLIAPDLRQCLHHLAQITGQEITTDEVLNHVFRHFCIGK